ncbi:MAG: FAD-dependent oxidoreductase [Pseudomonadota bacterium]
MYPSFAHHAASVVHIRRGGALDTQLIASVMLDQFKALGGTRLQGQVTGVTYGNNFAVQLQANGQAQTINCQHVVTAAGPCAAQLSRMLRVALPLENVLQQKVSFEDTLGVIPRELPFTIDIDDISLDWSAEEKLLLSQDAAMKRFTKPMPGAIHCRPEGTGKWVKLGWAYNTSRTTAVRDPELDAEFPEIVVRGASRLHPGLKNYIGAFPAGSVHYGGYYTMTPENWPLIGETEIPGYLIAAGLSGFGSMAACATGELIASLVTGRPVASYATDLSLQRYANPALLQELANLNDKGLL